MSVKEKVEAFCTQCGTRVVLQFRRVDIGVDVVGCEPCRITARGTVYCECPGCGEDVALQAPYAAADDVALAR
jgi:hypothetical protein